MSGLEIHGLDADLDARTEGLLVVRMDRALSWSELMQAHRRVAAAWGESLPGEEPEEDEGDEGHTFWLRFIQGPLQQGAVREAVQQLSAVASPVEGWLVCQSTGVDLVTDLDEPGWRDGPPPGAQPGELMCALTGYPQILEDFDWEDFGITVTLAGEPLAGERDVVGALHTLWLGTYIDERVLDDGAEADEDEEDPTCFRQGSVAWDGRRATLWVDRFNHPGTVEQVVHHLLWIVDRLSQIVPLERAVFGSADMGQKYGGLLPPGGESRV